MKNTEGTLSCSHTRKTDGICWEEGKTLKTLKTLVVLEHDKTVFTSQTRMCPSVPPVSRRLRSELNLTTFWRGSWGFRSDDTSATLVTEMWAVSSFKSDTAPPSSSTLCPFPARRLTAVCCSLFPATTIKYSNRLRLRPIGKYFRFSSKPHLL